MTDPSHPPPVSDSSDGSGDAAVSCVPPSQIVVLRQRADFLKAAQARRAGTAGFLLQARPRAEGEAGPDTTRIGYTCSKKIGNAVTRNRAKRRLRAVAREVMPRLARPGWDYVLVGRPEHTVSRDFSALVQDLQQALTRVHSGDNDRRPRPPRPHK
ncbi:ribonuclease P protein component [Paracoccus jeotgali]|uniref:ribonuclease P protein component n=1 Tax=Paracoccus jeotgali TaxID=2065379 RepID=UPI0035E45EF2